MAKQSTQYFFKGKRLKRGTRLLKGKGWRLTKRPGGTMFVGSLVETFRVGSETFGIFKIKRAKKSES